MLHDGGDEIDIVAKTFNLEPVKRSDLQVCGLVAGFSPCDQFCNHRVIEHRHFAAVHHAIVYANAIDAADAAFPARNGRVVADKATGAWQKPAIGVFGIDAVFDRPTVEFDIVLRHAEFLTSGNADHLFDQIDTGDTLGDGMLHLQAGVHFEEIETFAARVSTRDDQFDRACRIIANCPRQSDALLAHRFAHLWRDKGRRRFLDNLLMSSLDGTFAFVEVQDIAVLVAQYLDLDMARVEDEFLDKHAVVAERVQPLALGRLKAFTHVGLIIGEPHPLAATTGAGLHHHRIADFLRNPHRMFGVVNLAHKARHNINACLHGQFLGLDLVPHRGNRVHRRADKGDAFCRQCLGKTGALGQETIARMHSLCAGLLTRRDDLLGDQIGLCGRRRPDMHRLIRHLHKRRARIGVGINRDGGDPHPARGFDDTASDLATVCD